MKAPTISVLCWRHGTVLEIATAASSDGEFRITVHTCMDCKREARLSGYNEHALETPQRGDPGHPDNEMGG